MDVKIDEKQDANRDLITGAPGAHPVGTGVGAAGVALAGAGVGSVVGGPAGAVIGAALGAIAGGLAGKSLAEQINPTVEESYWRTNFASRPYGHHGVAYEQYAPAYRYGWETRSAHEGKGFKEVEKQLEAGWDKARGASTLPWSQARSATRDAWHRVDTPAPGDGDRILR